MLGGFRSWGKAEDLCRVRGVRPRPKGPQWVGEQGTGMCGGGFLPLQDCLLFFHSLPLTSQKGARGLRSRMKVTLIECLLYAKHSFCPLHKPESIIAP